MAQRESQAQGHTVELSGKVTDMKGEPVSDARVALLPDCDCKTCSDYPKGCSCCPDQVILNTDEQGHYQAKVQPGRYSVVVGQKRKMVDMRSTEKVRQDFKVDMSKPASPGKKKGK